VKRIFFFFLFLVAFCIIFTTGVHAQLSSPSVTPSPTPVLVKYDLAYPGILPDNPLYKLKVLRDKITLALIANPQKKIEYLLLQTDKGILATAMLIDKGEIDLAQQTALKAENNYTLITQELFRLVKQPDQSFFDNLKTASLKHQEVLTSIIKRVPADKQLVFKQVIDFSKRNYQSIMKAKSDMWK
jgi:hypothetical protein